MAEGKAYISKIYVNDIEIYPTQNMVGLREGDNIEVFIIWWNEGEVTDDLIIRISDAITGEVYEEFIYDSRKPKATINTTFSSDYDNIPYMKNEDMSFKIEAGHWQEGTWVWDVSSTWDVDYWW